MMLMKELCILIALSSCVLLSVDCVQCLIPFLLSLFPLVLFLCVSENGLHFSSTVI